MDRIIGNRIYLRPIDVSDTESIVNWRNTKFVQENFIFREPFSADMHMDWMRTKVETGKVIQYIICDSNNKSIGSVYFRDIDLKNKSAEFGIFIGEKDALGKGYGKEATSLFIKYGFECLGFEKIILRVIDQNKKASHMYESVGFRKIYDETQVSYPSGEELKVIFMEIKNK